MATHASIGMQASEASAVAQERNLTVHVHSFSSGREGEREGWREGGREGGREREKLIV